MYTGMCGLHPCGNKDPNVPKKDSGSYPSNPYRYAKKHGGEGFKADVIEKDNKYEIIAELAGVKKEDLRVEVDDETISITATKRQSCDYVPEENKSLCKERVIGTFQRQFPLENIKVDKIKTDFTDGMLTVDVPKLRDENKSRQKINIE